MPFRTSPPVLVLVLAVGMAGACAESEPPPPPLLAIPVAEVIQRDQPIHMEMVGETRGSSDIPIRTRVEGELIGMHFTEGRRVEQGQLLYTIDPIPYESKVVESQGHLASSRTRLAKAKADLERIRPLAEMHAVSQQDLDGAVAQYEAAVGSVQAAEARLEPAQIELGYTRISSPISGRIGITEASVGEFVGRQPNPVVLNFVSLTDPIRVRFSIDERRYLALARRIRQFEREGTLGQGVLKDRPQSAGGLDLILADGTIHEYRGRTTATDAAVDAKTGTFTLEADFPNPEDLVLAGQFARVRSVVETREGALLVPQRAVSELQGIFRVYVVGEDGVVAMRAVELGPKIDKLVIVDKGLEPGDRIALEVARLRPDMKVAPEPVRLSEDGSIVEQEPPAADAAEGTDESEA